VEFRKSLNFRLDFIFNTTRKVCSVAVAVTTAFVLRTYWALVAGIVTASVAGLVLSYAMHPYRPRPSLKSASALLHFSKWLALDNVLQFARFRASDFLISRIAGTSPLGIFNLANEVASIAQTTLAAPINRVLLPGYSRIAADRSTLHRWYTSTLAVTSLCIV